MSVATDQAAQAAAEVINAEHLVRATVICPQVQGRVLIGKPVEQIVAEAKAISADLMVIGRQRYNIMPFALGGRSIMQQIAGAMDVPTLIVHS